jgi:Flp pilus assembly protein TadD
VTTAAGAVKTEFGLTEEQRLRMLEISKDRIDALPRELTPEAERRLERLFRDFYRDDVVSPKERQEIEGAAREEKLASASVETVELRVRSRTTATRRSIDRSRALLGEKRYEEARQELQRAVEEDPDDPILWANLGAVHAREGRSEEARFCYNRALRLEPHLWLAHYNLGLLEERGGNRDSAIQHLKSALASLGSDAPRERQSMIENLLGDPDLEGLRRDARFSSLLSVTGTSTSRGQG